MSVNHNEKSSTKVKSPSQPALGSSIEIIPDTQTVAIANKNVISVVGKEQSPTNGKAPTQLVKDSGIDQTVNSPSVDTKSESNLTKLALHTKTCVICSQDLEQHKFSPAQWGAATNICIECLTNIILREKMPSYLL